MGGWSGKVMLYTIEDGRSAVHRRATTLLQEFLMKKNIGFLFFLGCLGICPCSTYSEDAFTQIFTDNWQVAHYGEEILTSLDFAGYITLDGTTVTNTAHINGYMHTRFADFSELFVKGHARIQDSKIRKNMGIEGELLAINVEFQKGLVCKSAKIVLSHCRLPNLTVKGLDEPGEQIVQLSDGTEISGTITFESGCGKVVSSKDSIPRRITGGILDISKTKLVVDESIR